MINLLKEDLRRATPGLAALAFLALAILPVWVHIAGLHRTHWGGPAFTDFFRVMVLPMGAKLWSLILLLASAGYASSAASRWPDRHLRLRSALNVALAGLVVVAVMGGASWLWLVRLGIQGPGEAVLKGVLGLLPSGMALVVSGSAGAFLPAAAAAALGVASGGLGYLAVAGALG